MKKRIISILLALSMTVSAGVSALAAPSDIPFEQRTMAVDTIKADKAIEAFESDLKKSNNYDKVFEDYKSLMDLSVEISDIMNLNWAETEKLNYGMNTTSTRDELDKNYNECSEYKEKIDKLVDAKIAVFHGFQEDPRPYYAMADCIVLPSYHEGMSNVLLEAAATGRPVITSNIPGCKEAVDDGKSGLLCEAEYRKMSKIAQMSRIEREAMGVCGRDKMAREFDKDKVVKKTIQGIERV